MSRRLTRRERAAGRTKGPSPSGYTTPADVAITAEQNAAEERFWSQITDAYRIAVHHVPWRPSTERLISMISLLAGRQ